MRTREHVLEELSRRAFRLAVPPEWVIRDQDPDYGLDIQVEPFAFGLPTGDIFFVQLKATDSSQRDIRLKTERLKHYVASKQPVLLVSFVAAENKLYCDWAHRVVRLIAKDNPRWWTQQTIVCPLTHVLGVDAPSQLLADVQSFYRALGGAVSSPATIEFELPKESDSESIEREIVLWLSRVSHGVRAVSSGNGIRVLVKEAWSRFEIHWSGVAGGAGTLEMKSVVVHEERVAVLKLLVAMSVLNAGLHRDAAALFRDLIETLNSDSCVATLLLTAPPWSVVGGSYAIDVALDIADALVGKGLLTQAMIAAELARLGLEKSPDAEALRHTQRLRRVFRAALDQTDNPGQRAVLFFNLGNSLRSSGLGKQALECFRNAAIALPEYLDTARWWVGVGSSLVMQRCFRFARRCLMYAVELEPAQFSLGLLGDVEFRLRRFSVAQSLLERWLKDNPVLDSDFILEWALVPLLLEEFGDGNRRVQAALKLAKDAYRAPREEQRALLHDALVLDPLCDYAWHNYANLRALESPDDAGIWWAAAALMSASWDVETCVSAYLHLLNKKEFMAGFVRLGVLWLSFRYHGEAFFLEIPRRIENASPETAASVVNNARKELAESRGLVR